MSLKLLDLFCCAGGCTRGYQQAGFWVRGVDIKPQPRYVGEEFVQADALEYLRGLIDSGEIETFDAVHASPPCQFASESTPMSHRNTHPNLIPATRRLLVATGKPCVIENVENARRHLVNPIMLCGSMFGLGVWRHRYFECQTNYFLPPAVCRHTNRPIVIRPGSNARKGVIPATVNEVREAIEIDWMTLSELSQAIPPAYTEFIGKHLVEHIERERTKSC